MKKKLFEFKFALLLFVLIVIVSPRICFSQSDIVAIQPAHKAINVNVGVLKWSASTDCEYDLYFGTASNPPLYKSGLKVAQEKPVIIELNKTYYWKIIEKKSGKEIRSSKIFSFSTLPIQLNSEIKYNSFVDERDDKIYWTITINGKEWFAQNLDYDLQDLSWYQNNSESNKIYGKLYVGSSLTSNLKDICPSGWHIPTVSEWTELIETVGGFKFAGKDLKENSELYWRKSEKKGTNVSGMTILPAGSRDSKPSFSNLGKYTFFWTSTPNPKIIGSFMSLDFGFMRDNINLSTGDKEWSYSIRCVKD